MLEMSAFIGLYITLAVIKCITALSGNCLYTLSTAWEPLPVWYLGLPMLSGLLAGMAIRLEAGPKAGQFFVRHFVMLHL